MATERGDGHHSGRPIAEADGGELGYPTLHGNYSAAGGKKGCSPQAGDGICTQMVETAVSGPTTNGSSVTTAKRGAPNPIFACWLMGFPAEWVSAHCGQCNQCPTRGGSPRRSPGHHC